MANEFVARMVSINKGRFGVITEIDRKQEVKQSAIDNKFLSLELNYLPEGYCKSNDGKYYNPKNNNGGISPFLYKLNGKTFNLFDKEIIQKEEYMLNEHKSYYYEVNLSQFNKILYIYYPEYDSVLKLYITKDVSKEEALKIVENIEITICDEETDLTVISNWENEIFIENNQVENNKLEMQSVNEEQIKELKQVGEAFEIHGSDDVNECYEVKVLKVKYLDNVNGLDCSNFNMNVNNYIDKNGRFLDEEVKYVKTEDGINDLSKVVMKRMLPVRLVLVTVEYTNTSGKDLEETLLLSLNSSGGVYFNAYNISEGLVDISK